MKSPNTKAMKNDLHLDLITLNSLPPRSPLGSVLNNGIKKLRTSCWYTEATSDIMPLIWRDRTQWLAVFFRHEQCDTVAVGPSGFDSDGLYDRWICQAGLTYKPSPNILIKADYGNIRFAVPPWGDSRRI